MKATITQLKKKINASLGNTGTSLDRRNPFWMNQNHIGYMKTSMEAMVTAGNAAPDRMFTPTEKQIVSLHAWMDSLKEKYL